MHIDSSKLVTLIKCKTLEEANAAAGLEVGNTGAFSIPVVAFRQGKRTVVTGALPMDWVKYRLESRSARSAKKGGSLKDSREKWNRPEIPEHSQAIARYIKDNHNKAYIIPPLSLNIQNEVHLYVPDYPGGGGFRPGYLVIPGAAKLAVTDGQHRKTAISLAMEQMDEAEAAQFSGDAVAVMITCETDLNQIHQDFADCSKTKPLPPSLLAVYDRRNPANRLVSDLEQTCPLFNGKIDPTSKTLSKKSTFLFLANQLRQLVKELLAGTSALTDVEFEKRAFELLGQESQYKSALKQFSRYINFLSGFSQIDEKDPDLGAAKWRADHASPSIKVWHEIAKFPAGSLETSRVPLRRQEGWVCLTATGLNIIGRVGHNLFSNPSIRDDWKVFASKLCDPTVVNWRRDAKMWEGNIIQGDKLQTQTAPLKRAYDQVTSAIGLSTVSSESQT